MTIELKGCILVPEGWRRGTLRFSQRIKAVLGAPVAAPDHARRAVLTALAMQREVGRLDAPFAARGWPALRIGVGINTGTMTVGDMGSEVRKSYTVMGDAVNLGSRLEGITKKYGVGVIVSETTKQRADNHVAARLEFRGIGNHDQLFGPAEHFRFGAGDQRITFDHAHRRDAVARHEHHRCREMLDGILVERRQDNALLAIDFAARPPRIGRWLAC